MTPAEALASQPDPVHGPDSASVVDWLLGRLTDPTLRDLIEQRRTQGIARYGVELRTHDGRDTVADAAQEGVDLALYLAKHAMESGLTFGEVEIRIVLGIVTWLLAQRRAP